MEIQLVLWKFDFDRSRWHRAQCRIDRRIGFLTFSIPVPILVLLVFLALFAVLVLGFVLLLVLVFVLLFLLLRLDTTIVVIFGRNSREKIAR